MQTSKAFFTTGYRVVLTALLSVIWAGAVLAASPDPAAIDAGVAELSHQLRCLVCQNQSIAESNAPLAVDLREQVRELLTAGQTREQIMDYMVVRYGDFVLYQPPFKASTWLLWLGPGLLFFSAVAGLLLTIRRRYSIVPTELSPQDRQRAQALLARKPVNQDKDSQP